MKPTNYEKKIIIKNKLGLHARPAAMFVEIASKYKSNIIIEKDGNEVDGKSIMGIMMLAAAKNTRLKIIAEGEDCKEAIEALAELIENKFEEE
jgi:phosphotransferase system HPr (HPr) family protein